MIQKQILFILTSLYNLNRPSLPNIHINHTTPQLLTHQRRISQTTTIPNILKGIALPERLNSLRSTPRGSRGRSTRGQGSSVPEKSERESDFISSQKLRSMTKRWPIVSGSTLIFNACVLPVRQSDGGPRLCNQRSYTNINSHLHNCVFYEHRMRS